MWLGPFWFAVELAPITIVVSLLRLNIVYTMLTIVFYEFVMNAAVFAFAPWNYGEFMALVIFIPWNFVFQLPIWAVTLLVLRLSRCGI